MPFKDPEAKKEHNKRSYKSKVAQEIIEEIKQQNEPEEQTIDENQLRMIIREEMTKNYQQAAPAPIMQVPQAQALPSLNAYLSTAAAVVLPILFRTLATYLTTPAPTRQEPQRAPQQPAKVEEVPQSGDNFNILFS